ncbi:hypothetical protein CJ030_MR4G016893 [Morella rubra]|uniref:Uncharacterized protein n=1 Tax=Morella rubra TaxID=262757 RepID=A0A6A1VS38_9ROSI|nr:hypothetical protein CJ030_MR4G016893 [Morella rubra]
MMECEGQGSVSIKEIAEEEGQKMEEIEKAQKNSFTNKHALKVKKSLKHPKPGDKKKIGLGSRQSSKKVWGMQRALKLDEDIKLRTLTAEEAGLIKLPTPPCLCSKKENSREYYLSSRDHAHPQKKGRSGVLALKVAIKKAYDKVDLGFLIEGNRFEAGQVKHCVLKYVEWSK